MTKIPIVLKSNGQVAEDLFRKFVTEYLGDFALNTEFSGISSRVFRNFLSASLLALFILTGPAFSAEGSGEASSQQDISAVPATTSETVDTNKDTGQASPELEELAPEFPPMTSTSQNSSSSTSDFGSTERFDVEQDALFATGIISSSFAEVQNARQDGAFQHSVAFNVPEFRGLVPNVGLVYNSNFTGLGQSEVWTGVGWSLSGFSSIERVAMGGGVPYYDDARDNFRFDGSELLACFDQWATSPYPDTYPDDYKSDNQSASCTAGGNLTTQIESYLKIERNLVSYGSGQVEEFFVWSKDGTRQKFESIGKLAGITFDTGHFAHKSSFKRKFLLTEIRDTQATPNIVSVQYAFGSEANALAHRPSSIEYAGYKIEFHYLDLSTPIARYGVGVADVMGQQDNLLRSVTVTDQANPVRGWRLDYQETSQVGRPLLQTIREFGSDFVLSTNPTDGTFISAGSELPALASSLTYTADGQSYNITEYQDQWINYYSTAIDVDHDGRDELLNRGNVGPLGQIPPDVQSFSDAHTSQPVTGKTTRFQYGGEKLTGFIGPLPGETGDVWQHVQRNFSASRAKIFRGPMYFHDLNAVKPARFGAEPCASNSDTCDAYVGGTVIGNFDRDPEREMLVDGVIHEVDGNLLTKDLSRGTNVAFPFLRKVMQSESTSERNTVASSLRFAIDLNGDGIDELIESFCSRLNTQVQANKGSIYAADMTGKYVLSQSANHLYSSTSAWGEVCRPTSSSGGSISKTYENFVIGDFNGDGLPDRYSPSQRTVQLGDGVSFSDPVVWSLPFPITNGQPRSATRWTDFVLDANGDGLDDVVIQKPAGGVPVNLLLLSNGTGFVAPGPELSAEFTTTDQGSNYFVGTGDFNGDGAPDLIRSYTSVWGGGIFKEAAIYSSSGGNNNLLTSFGDANGATTSITYKSSTNAADTTLASGQVIDGQVSHKIPNVLQVVDTITRDNGRGQTRQLNFTFENPRYNYEHRELIGFGIVTAYLPAIAGEAEGPQVFTIYEGEVQASDHIAYQGLVSSRVTQLASTIWAREDNDWSVVGSGVGPFKRTKTQSRAASRSGTALLESTTQYAEDLYGNRTERVELGFTDGSGADIATGDNRITRQSFLQNLTAYIVDRPEWGVTMQGTDPSTSDASRRLIEERYHYDGQALGVAPTRGNLTKVQVMVNNSPPIYDDELLLSYDNFGNILSETDANGNVTQHEYDTARNLFKTATINALTQRIETQWSAACQAPSQVTDLNNLNTTQTFDVHCRELRTDMPGGNYIERSYLNFGDPTAQSILTKEPSGSNVSGRTVKQTLEYFNGFGETYRVGTSQATTTELVGVLMAYDQRGNTLWESNPLDWVTATSASPNLTNNKTDFEYDTLGRPTKTTYPDDHYMAVAYSTSDEGRWGASVSTPTSITKDAHCYDAPSENTTCGEFRQSTDTRGNVILSQTVDVNGSDIDGTAGTTRNTTYTFDLLDRLVQVDDPNGAQWIYVYNFRGHRTSADDPGLGLWALVYDDNGNLLQQTDAKSQIITFTYDALNRVLQKQVIGGSNGTQTTTFTYDEMAGRTSNSKNIGQLTTQTLGTYEIETDYNNLGLPKKTFYSIGSRKFEITTQYWVNGLLRKLKLPNHPGTTNKVWTGNTKYDAASRVTSFGSDVTSVDYDLRSNPTRMDYANGFYELRTYDAARGWLNDIELRDASAVLQDETDYERTATGRIQRMTTKQDHGSFTYTYDYTGRLLSAVNTASQSALDQSFTYDKAGSMRSNSQVGDYLYNTANPRHAPYAIDNNGNIQNFTYDANGNQLTGLDGKVMTYDGENRPLSVTHNGVTTTYEYGPDGSRWKKIENTGTATENETAYFDVVEIRDYNSPGEVILTYPNPSVRYTHTLVAGQPVKRVDYLHRDQLESVRTVSNSSAQTAKLSTYKPFGEIGYESIPDIALTDETKGFIGERYDADAGLQYLNARYYDPKLALFIQPDWFEVTEPGVGTNRYAYSNNDPINLKDPDGNFFVPGAIIGAIGGLVAQGLSDALSGNTSSLADYGRAAALGAAAGATGGLAGGVVAKGLNSALSTARTAKAAQHANVIGGVVGGATGGATGSILDQATQDGLANPDFSQVDSGQVAEDTAKGALVGGVLGGAQIGSVVGDNVAKTIPGALGKLAGDVASTLTDMFTDTIANEGIETIDNRMDRQERDGEEGGHLGF